MPEGVQALIGVIFVFHDVEDKLVQSLLDYLDLLEPGNVDDHRIEYRYPGDALAFGSIENVARATGHMTDPRKAPTTRTRSVLCGGQIANIVANERGSTVRQISGNG